MKRYLQPILLLLAFTAIATNVQAQKKGSTTIGPDPDSILVGKRQQPSVFLAGSFHFGYYNLDAHKTDKDKQVDILSEQRQKEMRELVAYISKFKPTKIAVEGGRNTGYLMRAYRDYKSGKKTLTRDEIQQIGFRLMDEFELDTIYGVNDVPLINDLYNTKDSLVMRPYFDTIFTDWDFRSDDSISKAYSRFYRDNDRLALKMPLLDYFKYSNSDKMLDRGFGAYLNGDFTLGNTEGADALALHWYSRNLRIYRHIQQITTSPNDRILVLFGRGHIEILKHLFECSPEYNLIKFGELE